MTSEPEARRIWAMGGGDAAIVTQPSGRSFHYRLALADKVIQTGARCC